jgi:hypothetical protein
VIFIETGVGMIKNILIGNREIETDSEVFIKKIIRELEKKGKVEGKDFFIRDIVPHLKKGGEMGK